MVLFTLMTFFFFNALFFTEEYISERYNSDDNIDIIYIINNEIEKSVYSSILGLLIGKIMIIITSFQSKFNKMIREKTSIEDEIVRLIFSYKLKIKIVFIIITLLSCIYWYYLIIFCSLYKNNQIGWIESSLVSIIFNMLLPILFCFVFGLVKYNGKIYKNKMMFVFGNFCLNLF